MVKGAMAQTAQNCHLPRDITLQRSFPKADVDLWPRNLKRRVAEHRISQSYATDCCGLLCSDQISLSI